MNRRNSLLCVVTLAFVASLAHLPAAATADDGVLQHIPHDALGCLVVRDLRKASDAIDQVAQQMELPSPGLLEIAKRTLQISEGIDESGGMAIAMVAGGPSGRPFPVILFKTMDFRELIGQLDPSDGEEGIHEVKISNRPMLAAKQGAYAAFAPPGNADLLKQFLASDKPVALHPQNRNDTKDSQAYLVVTDTGVSTISQLAVSGLQLVKQQLSQAGPDAQMAVAGIGLYEEMFKWADKEVGEVAVGIQAEADGNVFLKKRVVLKNSAAQLDDPQRESAVGMLAALPDWPYAVKMAGQMTDGPDMEQLLEMSINMMQSIGTGQKASEEDLKQLLDSSKTMMAGMTGMSFIFGVPQDNQSMYSRMGMVVHVADAKAYLGNYIDYTKKAGAILNEAGLYKIVEAQQQQVAGLPGAKLVMQLPLDDLAQGPQAEAIRKMFDRLYGNGGKITFYLAQMDAKRVAIGYDSVENVKAVMKAARSGRGPGAKQSHAVTAKLLGGKPHWAGYISPQGVVQYGEWLMNITASLSPAGVAPKVPAFPGNSPPFGLGLTFAGDGIEFEMVAPAETLTSLGRYVKVVQQAGAR